MRKDFVVESVTLLNDRIRVGIVVYRRYQPPMTAVFEKKWGSEEVRHIRNECRADGSGINAPELSEKQIESAQGLAERAIEGRKTKRQKEVFWAKQPRLF